MKTKKIIVQI